MKRTQQLALGLFNGAIILLAAHPTCHFVFDCGCSAVWNGGVTTCQLMPGDVSVAAVCPLCATHGLVLLLMFLTVWLSGLAAALCVYSAGRLWLSVSVGVTLSLALLLTCVWGAGLYHGFPEATRVGSLERSVCSGGDVD